MSDQSTAAGSTSWSMYLFGGIAALIAGVIALVRGRRGGLASERQAGTWAIMYAVGSVAFIAIFDALPAHMVEASHRQSSEARRRDSAARERAAVCAKREPVSNLRHNLGVDVDDERCLHLRCTREHVAHRADHGAVADVSVSRPPPRGCTRRRTPGSR